MARERAERGRVKEVLRLRLAFGLSHKAIGAACRMPRTTVRDYCQRAKAAGLDSFAAIEPLSERALEARLFTTGVDRDAPDPDTTLHLSRTPRLTRYGDTRIYEGHGVRAGRADRKSLRALGSAVRCAG